MKSFNEIKNYTANVGSNSVSVFGGNFEGGYQLQQDVDEVSNLIYDMQNLKIKNYLEIGVAAAGFTRLFTDFLQIENICTIDLGEHPSIPAAYENNTKNFKNTGQFKSFIGDSHSVEAKKWLQACGLKFDCIFIDGDHSYNGVVEDLYLAKEFAQPNSLFIFHDHACVADIGRLYDEIKNKLHRNFVLHKQYVSNNTTKKGIFVAKYMGV